MLAGGEQVHTFGLSVVVQVPTGMESHPMSWSVILVFPLFALAFVAGVRASCNGELRKRPVRRRLTALSGVRDRANRRLRTHLCVSGFSPRQVFCCSGSGFCWVWPPARACVQRVRRCSGLCDRLVCGVHQTPH